MSIDHNMLMYLDTWLQQHHAKTTTYCSPYGFGTYGIDVSF